MIPLQFNSLSLCLRIGLVLLGMAAGQGYGHAENTRLDLYLVWGTSEVKSSDATHKPLDEGLAIELRKVCKWTNYYVINRTNVIIVPHEPKKVEMSKKCLIDMKLLDGQRLEVQLFGEGKARDKVIKPLSKNKSITFAGQDKNDTAWFVIIKQTD